MNDAIDSFGDLKGLVFDLRGNPGGLLSQAVEVCDHLLAKGQSIVSPARARLSRPGLHGHPRQRRQDLPHRGAGQPQHGFGGGDCLRRVAGSRPRPDRGRNHLRQGPGADGLQPERKHRPGADHLSLLHALGPADPAQLRRRFALRLLLQPRRRAARRTRPTARSSSPTRAARSTAAAASRRTRRSRAPRATTSRTSCSTRMSSSTSPRVYLANHTVDKNFQVDDAVLAEFKKLPHQPEHSLDRCRPERRDGLAEDQHQGQDRHHPVWPVAGIARRWPTGTR